MLTGVFKCWSSEVDSSTLVADVVILNTRGVQIRARGPNLAH